MSEGDGELETRLANLAAYHVGMFTGAVGQVSDDPHVMAHALLKLANEATSRCEQWVASHPGLERKPS